MGWHRLICFDLTRIRILSMCGFWGFVLPSHGRMHWDSSRLSVHSFHWENLTARAAGKAICVLTFGKAFTNQKHPTIAPHVNIPG